MRSAREESEVEGFRDFLDDEFGFSDALIGDLETERVAPAGGVVVMRGLRGVVGVRTGEAAVGLRGERT